MIKEHFRIIDERRPSLHDAPVSGEEPVRDVCRVPIKVSRANNVVEVTKSQPKQERLIHMHKTTLLIFDEKTDSRKMFK